MVQVTIFRPEIARLRAIAVASVVLSYLKVSGFAGGFVGVDVFFVISGYLITKRILSDLEQGQFSFLDFYLRRARRIVPALLFTVAVSFLVGALWLSPQSFRALAKEATHALLSISNYEYWRESKEYFAAASEQLPFLHCWSLSVEEQFYLVWPAFLMFATRTRLVPAILLIAGLSFVAGLFVMGRDTQAAFFLTPFRVFEFAIGALVILAERRGELTKLASECLGLGGVAAIGASIILFDPTTAFPGFPSLLPVIGAAAVVLAGSFTSLGKLIDRGPVLFLGAISYSLYLCHWPILFFARYILDIDSAAPCPAVVLIAAMIAVATAMFWFIEKPFQRAHRPSFRSSPKSLLRYAGVLGAFTLLCHVAFVQDGWSWRLSAHASELIRLQKFGMDTCKPISEMRCAFGALDGPVVLELVGDSLSHQYVAAFDPLLKKLGLRGETSTLGGCPILVGVVPNDSRERLCRETRDALFDRLRMSNVNIVLGQAWGIYNDQTTTSQFVRSDVLAGFERSMAQLETSLAKTLDLLENGTRRILLVGEQVTADCVIDKMRLTPGPLWHAPQSSCQPGERDAKLKSTEAINAMLQNVQSKRSSDVRLLRPVDYICDERCPVFLNGAWLYIDAAHFSVAGSELMGQRADAVFRWLIREP